MVWYRVGFFEEMCFSSLAREETSEGYHVFGPHSAVSNDRFFNQQLMGFNYPCKTMV